MASRSYDGNYKAYLLATAPSSWEGSEEGERTVTSTEIEAGTRLERLISDGGVTYSFTTNTASQALIDSGKVGHNIGTREVTGGRLIHERSFPAADDDMWGLYAYGDKRWLVISPDGEPAEDALVHVFEIEVGETETFQPGRDTIQNFQVSFAVQDWDMNVTVSA